MRVALALLLCACGAAPHAPAPPTQRALVKPRAPYTILPGELGDPGILERIPHHARIARFGRVWLRPADAPIARGDDERGARPVLGVLGETRDRLRVVSDQDDARLALWIDRADAAPAIIAPIVLGADGDAGVFLAPGADIDVGAARGADREITLRDPMLRVHGFVDARAIGAVWVGRHSDPPVENDAALDFHALIRAAPRADAAVLAEALQDLPVRTVGDARDGWTEIEVEHEGVRVRGFTESRHVSHGDLYGVGDMGGAAYGISDTDFVDVPAGACLYDRRNGQVIGVNTKARQRYGHRRDAEWPSVYVGTHWGILLVTLHNPSGTAALITPESCVSDR